MTKARALFFVIVAACMATVATWASEEATLTADQQFSFQKALAAFYLAASNLNAASAQLERSKAQLADARQTLSLACPGDIVDVEGKPAECRLKTPEAPKKDEKK